MIKDSLNKVSSCFIFRSKNITIEYQNKLDLLDNPLYRDAWNRYDRNPNLEDGDFQDKVNSGFTL